MKDFAHFWDHSLLYYRQGYIHAFGMPLLFYICQWYSFPSIQGIYTSIYGILSSNTSEYTTFFVFAPSSSSFHTILILTTEVTLEIPT